MKLETFNYQQNNWQIKNLKLDQLNLIVGNNSSGKTKTLEAITNIGNILSSWSPVRFINKQGHWKAQLTFKNKKGDTIQYNIANQADGITEELYQNEEKLLDRKPNKGKIFSYSSNKFESVSPPKNKLIMHVRRDVKEFPYLEKIAKWAEYNLNFDFSALPYREKTDAGVVKESERPLYRTTFDAFPTDWIGDIIKDFRTIGFPITKVYPQMHWGQETLYFVEEGIEEPISQHQLSRGMYRAFFLILLIYKLIRRGKPTVLFIDDLGEGLDYRRATNLGKLLFDKLARTNISLIATSNHSFLMDVVDIRHWNILIRDKAVVSAYNYSNSKELFEEFEFSGLSNFDLFSSDYLKSKIK